jgi:hypothetical protein
MPKEPVKINFLFIIPYFFYVKYSLSDENKTFFDE